MILKNKISNFDVLFNIIYKVALSHRLMLFLFSETVLHLSVPRAIVGCFI